MKLNRALDVLTITGFGGDLTFFENHFPAQNGIVCPAFKFHAQFGTEFLGSIKVFQGDFLFRINVDDSEIRIAADHDGPFFGV